jgi:hypothetical protein
MSEKDEKTVQEAEGTEEKQGRGRPKGSINKRSEAFREMVLNLSPNYKHPGEILMEAANNEELPIELRLMAAEKLMPYLEPKLRVQEITAAVDANSTFTGVIFNAVPPTPDWKDEEGNSNE